jgi:hypothetical protein
MADDDSVGKVSLDFEISSDLEKQTKNAGKVLAESFEENFQKSMSTMFDKIGSSLSDSMKVIQDSMSQALDAMINKLEQSIKRMTEMFKDIRIKQPDQNFTVPTSNVSIPQTTIATPKIRGPPVADDIQADYLLNKMNLIGEEMDALKNKSYPLKDALKDALDGSDEANKLQSQLLKIEQRLNELRFKFDQVGASYDAINNKQLNLGGEQVEQEITIWARLKNMIESVNLSLGKVVKGLTGLGGRFKQIGKQLGNVIKKIGSLGKGIKTVFNKLNPFSKGLNNVGNSANKSALNFGKLTRSLIVSNLIMSGLRRGVRALSTSLWNSLKANDQFNHSLNQIKTNLQVAFMPIYSAILPALNALMSALVTITSTIANFFNALFGSTYNASLATAKSLNTATGAVKKYGKAVKEVNNSTGLDELNIVSPNQETPDNDSGGGTGGGGLVNGNMGDGGASDFAQMIKDAWANADFTDIGRIVGEKINRALESINWTKIQATLDKIAKSTATFLNGFIEATDWTLVGYTLAQGINTVFRTADTFATNFDWSNLGNAIGDGINGVLNNLDWGAIKSACINVTKGIADTLNSAMKTIDWGLVGYSFGQGINTIFDIGYTFVSTFDWGLFGFSIAEGINGAIHTIEWGKIGKTLSDGTRGLLKSLIEFITNLDWGALGRAIFELLASIDWFGIIADLALVIGTAILGIHIALFSFIAEAVGNIGNYFAEKIKECGGYIIIGLFRGIIDAMVGISTWLYNNLAKPFVDAFKKLFGINSPSTVFAELGGFIMQGLLNGISALIALPAELFMMIWDGISAIFTNVGSWFDEKFTGAREAVFSAFSSVGQYFGNVWQGIKDAFGNITGWFRDQFSRAWQAVKDVFSSGGAVFSGITDGILNGLKAVINALIKGINSIVAIPFNGLNSALNALRSLSLPVIGAPFGFLPTIDVPKIPMLAQGGYVEANTPQLAIIGDNKHQGEVVAPEDKLFDVNMRALKEFAGNQNNDTSPESIELFKEMVMLMKEMIRAINAIDLYIGDRDIARANRRGQKQLGHNFEGW